MEIEAIILYCSIDELFLKTCVENLISIGIKCNVVSYTNLYMGAPENDDTLNEVSEYFKDNPLYKHKKLQWEEGKAPLHWEAWGRYYAIHNMLNDSCKHILFIDTDELIDPVATLRWLNTGKYKQYNGIKLHVYTYSHHPTYQCTNITAFNTILCKTDYVKSLPFQAEARLQYFNNKNKTSRRLAKIGLNPWFYVYRGIPFVHHFTGVRTWTQKVLKFSNWSHLPDRTDWIEIISNETMDMVNLRITNRLGTFKFKIVKDMFNLVETFENACKLSSL